MPKRQQVGFRGRTKGKPPNETPDDCVQDTEHDPMIVTGAINSSSTDLRIEFSIGTVIFVTLEDEAEVANVIVWPSVFDRFRRALLESRLLRVAGRLQREGIVIHVVADRLTDLTEHLRSLGTIEGDGEGDPASANGAAHSIRDPSEAFPEGRNFR